MARLLHLLTDLACGRRGKYVVLVAWLVLAGALSPLSSKLSSLYDQSLTTALPPSAPSQQALSVAQHAFPGSRDTPAIVVLFDPAGLGLRDRRIASGISAWLSSRNAPGQVAGLVSVYRTPQVGNQLISPDGTTMMMVAELHGASDATALNRPVQAIRRSLESAVRGSSMRAYLSGPAGIAVDAAAVFTSVDRNLLLATVGLVLVLLVLLYRSPSLPFVPLLSVGVVIGILNGLLALAAGGGLFPVGQMPVSIATVLLFGAGTDYTLFIVSRFREELRRTPDHHLAMRRTMRAVGGAIASSGGTVLLSVLTLLLAGLALYSSLGWVLAIAMGVMLCAGLTLVPALLTALGRIAFWPLVPRAQPGPASAAGGVWSRIGRGVVLRPRIAVAVGLVLLCLLAFGSLGTAPSLSLLDAFRAANDSRTGFDVLRQHQPPGELAPTSVLIVLGDRRAFRSLAAVDAATAAASGVPGVASVRSLTRPDGALPGIPIRLLQETASSVSDGVLRGDAPAPSGLSARQRLALGLLVGGSQYVSAGGSTVQLTVVFADDPYGIPAIARVGELRSAVQRAVPWARVLASGQTAELADASSISERDTVIVVAAVLLVVAVVLALLLRSLIAPAYLLAVLGLNYLAVLGIANVLFVRVLHQDGLNYAVPLYVFVFLVSLGADYTIFLMSRVREEASGAPLSDAVVSGLGRTGGVISSAGLILAGTFSVLSTLPLTVLYQLGLAVAVGVLLDTFVVRAVILPGLITLLRHWNWWPSAPGPRRAAPQRSVSMEVTTQWPER